MKIRIDHTVSEQNILWAACIVFDQYGFIRKQQIIEELRVDFERFGSSVTEFQDRSHMLWRMDEGVEGLAAQLHRWFREYDELAIEMEIYRLKEEEI